MTYFVNQACINCKHTDCVEVRPVDCFYVGENMLVINPDECIDCGVCEPECPVDAIFSDADNVEDKEYWLDVNQRLSEQWPNLTKKMESMSEADKYNPDNYEKDKTELLSEKPGQGDDKS